MQRRKFKQFELFVRNNFFGMVNVVLQHLVSLRKLSCTKFRPGLSELKTIPFPVLCSTYRCPKVSVPASILSCIYLYSQLEQAHFLIIYPLGFQNASCKGTSRTESICLKDTFSDRSFTKK